MKAVLSSLFLVGLVALSGCQNSAPSVHSGAALMGRTVDTGPAVPVNQNAFTVLPATGEIDPTWLQTPTNLFRLGPSDVIEIEILGERGSRAAALVGPDGKIYYGLLPGLFVWGLTLSETKALLDEKLAEYFRNRPLVSVTLRDVNSRRIWILGNVQAPGIYGLATPQTVLEAISLAGGTAPTQTGSSADTDYRGSFILRQGRPVPVDLDRLLRQGDMSQNIYLEPDDFLYLRPGEGQYVYVLGAVRRTGAIPFASRMSLAQAVATMGGPVTYARLHQVGIVRGSLNQPMITTADYGAIVKGKAPDLLLEPGDIVFVPFVAYRQLADFGDQILRQFVSTIGLNEGFRAVRRGSSPVGVSVGGVP